MKKNKDFIIGILTGMVLIPIVEELITVIFQWIEYMKILPSKLILKGNKELAELQGDAEGYEETSAIGFHYEPKEEYYEDDYEE